MIGRLRGCLILLIAISLLLLLPFFLRQIVSRYYASSIHDAAGVPTRKTAIVFGAAVFSGDRLSTVLRDRMDTAIELYRQGFVGELLVSGDGASSRYNEPEAMMNYAVRNGIPEEDILTDAGGRRTYDTCYRARHLFGVQDAILVTQRFHLPRALFLCGFLDIEAVGVPADQRLYRGARWYEFRETAATLVALADAMRRPEPAVTSVLPTAVQGNE
ncbi:MAG: YdcF family protein [Chloroflexota bacterium]|nr:MAG: YdcF family protein [Chloroflexota bacterium]